MQRKFTTLVLVSAALVVGWLAANTGLVVEAQRDRTDPNGREPVTGLTRTPAVSRVAGQIQEVLPTIDCVFTVVDVGPDRGTILVDAPGTPSRMITDGTREPSGLTSAMTEPQAATLGTPNGG